MLFSRRLHELLSSLKSRAIVTACTKSWRQPCANCILHIGHIFGFPHHRTWEFSASQPTRSVFPLWPVYGLPMTILQWIWTETGEEEVAPKIVFYTLRVVMFILSFVLEDWAIHELVQSPRQRRVAVILVASSYVTSTYQTHTFSNSIETLLVLWSLVLIGRILETKVWNRENIAGSEY